MTPAQAIALCRKERRKARTRAKRRPPTAFQIASAKFYAWEATQQSAPRRRFPRLDITPRDLTYLGPMRAE